MASKHKRGGWRWGVGVAVLAVVYVLSYPAMVRWGYGPNERYMNGDSVYAYEFGYGPIEWLIDFTPARTPMLWWSRVWGVDEIVAEGVHFRGLERKAHRK